MPGKKTDILETIEAEYERLSPQLRLAARFVLDSPDRVALHSMREIAAQADVLPPTMIRLVKRLGFSSYNDFRDRFRDRIVPETGTYAARARQLQLRNSLGSDTGFLGEMSETDMRNIEQTFASLEEEAIRTAAQTLIDAKTIYIIGLRKCFPVAFYIHYALRNFFPAARLLQGQAGLFREEISFISGDDAVIVIAFDPYTKETVRAARSARDAGGSLIAITDSVVSPLSDGAEHLFLAANRSPSFYRSLVGALAIAQALVAAVVDALGVDAVEKLENSEKRLRRSNTYWQNGDKS